MVHNRVPIVSLLHYGVVSVSHSTEVPMAMGEGGGGPHCAQWGPYNMGGRSPCPHYSGVPIACRSVSPLQFGGGGPYCMGGRDSLCVPIAWGGGPYVSLLHGGDPIVLGEGWGDVPSATPNVQMGKLRHRQWVGGGGRGGGLQGAERPIAL